MWSVRGNECTSDDWWNASVYSSSLASSFALISIFIHISLHQNGIRYVKIKWIKILIYYCWIRKRQLNRWLSHVCLCVCIIYTRCFRLRSKIHKHNYEQWPVKNVDWWKCQKYGILISPLVIFTAHTFLSHSLSLLADLEWEKWNIHDLKLNLKK